MHFHTYIQSIQNNLQRGSERTHYPAIKNLLDNPAAEISATIEEKGNFAGIPDFTVRRRELLVGYIEAKDIGEKLDLVEKTEQLQRYRESLNNLLLTNYLEFRWYVEGKLRLKATLAQRVGDEIKLSDTAKTSELIEAFLNYTGAVINSPEDLAKQMARLTKSIRLATESALGAETSVGELHQLKRGFNEILLPDLDDSAFADMYAQTVSYGLFAARVGHAQNPNSRNSRSQAPPSRSQAPPSRSQAPPGNAECPGSAWEFSRRTAGTYIPATNPFLKRLFNTIVETDLIGQINWAIDDLVQLLASVNMSSILENFGRRTRTEDPVVHFYETFLAAYDSALRKTRGVYYTPEPVVSFIVRSVDAILKKRFNLPLGLADYSTNPTAQQSAQADFGGVSAVSTAKQPRVQILDPATGTGTFLYGVINQIYQNLEEMGIAGSWNQYVEEHLLGRLFGFELLMAPYAIAHLKLGLQLQDLGYEFTGKQRLGVYLTNTLDEALKKSEVLFAQFIANEANEASAIKRDVPVMVVLGNPPYSVSSSNKGDFIKGLMERYKKAVQSEKNIQPLSDDYIKFIRFAHHQIEQTGYGIVAFITNHSYLNGLIHRGMREELLKTFDQIYVMDLHGNSLLKEIAPDGSPDRNVFDIQQGVAILIAVKDIPLAGKSEQKLSKVFHHDLWGSRQNKYEVMNNSDVDSIPWSELQPEHPNYFFAPKNFDLSYEYNRTWPINEIFTLNSTGIKTHRDHFVIEFDESTLKHRIEDFLNPNQSDKEVRLKYFGSESRGKYPPGDTRDWQMDASRLAMRNDPAWREKITKCTYRIFDKRVILYHLDAIDLGRYDVMQHLLKANLAILSMRGIREDIFNHFFISECLVLKDAVSIKDSCYVFPLYIYPDTENEQGNLLTDRTPNLSQNFLSAIREKLGYIPTPEAIFYYAYAVFHSPTYRQRYAEFLKIDFPRLPLTDDDRLFKALGEKGQELVELHLMKSPNLNKPITKYPVSGDNAVTEVTYKPDSQRVYINKQQYFEGIAPEVWEFKIGGYQVLDKWLKDRKKANRSLSFDDVLHYQRVVVALKETMQIMTEIDAIIPIWPLE